MIAQARFKCPQWMLVAVLALVPTAVFAQEDKPPQAKAAEPKTEEAQRATEAVQTKTEAQGQTEGAQTPAEKDKVISGMSVLGNQDAPKSLVIVPWKSSEIGKSLGISTMLDDSRQPIDREVFMRGLSYYEIRSQATRTGSAPAANNAAPATTGAQGRK